MNFLHKRKHFVKYALGIFLIIFAIIQLGCKKLVELPPPVSTLVTSSVFSNNSTATAAQLAIYNKMLGLSYTIELNTGLSSDELINYAASNTDLYTNSLIPESVVNIWSDPYNIIFQANAVIEGLQNNNSVSDKVNRQLTGEAKFVRAFWHFYLVNLYGDVPIVTSTDYRVNGVIRRSSQAQVYEQIIGDLKDAQDLLNSGFVDASDTTVYASASTERVRPTKWAAKAMLARAYLYTGDWVNAEAAATDVINNNMFSLVPTTNIAKVFTKNSQEAIWQLMLPPSKYYTNEGSFFILTAGSVPTVSSISTQLYNAFEATDKRKTWISSIMATVSGQPKTFYFAFKYQAGSKATAQTEYNMVLRLAEQYLIRAEARAQQNNTIGAAADLNAIRGRAGLAPSTATSKADLLAAIAQERRVELFAEWGDRWLNLKRTGKVDSVMNIITPQKGGGTWSSYQQFYPVPLTEISNNPNMIQTPGY